MAAHNRTGCMAYPGERCWGMRKGQYAGPCEWCKEEVRLMEEWYLYGYQSDYGPANSSYFCTTEIETEGMVEVPPSFHTAW